MGCQALNIYTVYPFVHIKITIDIVENSHGCQYNVFCHTTIQKVCKLVNAACTLMCVRGNTVNSTMSFKCHNTRGHLLGFASFLTLAQTLN